MVMSYLSKAKRHYQRQGLRSLSSAVMMYATKGLRNRLILRSMVEWEQLDDYDSEVLNIGVLAEEDDVLISDSAQMPDEFEFAVGTYPTDRRKVYEIKNCTMAGDRAVVFDTNSDIVLEASGGNVERFLGRSQFLLGDEYTPTLSRVVTGRNITPNREIGKLFSLVSIYKQGYYFWLLEYLPKLRALEQYIENERSRPKILLQPEPPSYMTESLAVAGYDSDDIIEWDKTPTRVNSLILTQHRMRKFSGRGPEGFDYNPSIRDIKWVRDRLTEKIDNSDSEYSDRIYISRQEATRERYVSNYEELMMLLSEKGFESYCLEKYPFEEQVKICANAEVIIGPHGAGLTNMIFARDATVLEIFNQEFLKSPYYLLSKEFGHDYWYYIGETEGEVNIRVDVGEFESILNKII